MIVLDSRSRKSLEKASYFKLTECGSYYLQDLINRFPYLDLVWVDTPIADIDLVKQLRLMIEQTDLSVRFKRTEAFLSYLIEMEDKEMRLHPEYQASDLGKFTFARRIRNGFEKDKTYILSKLLKNTTK